MRGWQHTVLLTYVSAHFLVVAVSGPALFAWPQDNPIGQWWTRYGAWTGATTCYGFFSPNVPDQVLIELTAVDAAGEKTVEVLGAGDSQTDLRIFSMMHLFTTLEVQDLQAQSLAAFMFGRHPQAEFVVVSLRLYRQPSMTAARAGEAPYLEEFYRAVFMRGTGPDQPHKQ